MVRTLVGNHPTLAMLSVTWLRAPGTHLLEYSIQLMEFTLETSFFIPTSSTSCIFIRCLHQPTVLELRFFMKKHRITRMPPGFMSQMCTDILAMLHLHNTLKHSWCIRLYVLESRCVVLWQRARQLLPFGYSAILTRRTYPNSTSLVLLLTSLFLDACAALGRWGHCA